MPQFQKQPWPKFTLRGVEFDLSHLDEYVFDLADAKEIIRKVAVTFEDHCFTRKWEESDGPEAKFPGCSRKPAGAFCEIRYAHSLKLREFIAQAVQGDVWIADGEGFAIIPTVSQNGELVLYCILFDLLKVRGLACSLRMLVRTAYPLDRERKFATHGSCRFRHLMHLKMESKRPARNSDHRRKQPKIK